MGRVLLAVLALAALGALAYRTVDGSLRADVPGQLPKERLDDVRGAAQRIEAEDQKRADDILKATEP